MWLISKNEGSNQCQKMWKSTRLQCYWGFLHIHLGRQALSELVLWHRHFQVFTSGSANVSSDILLTQSCLLRYVLLLTWHLSCLMSKTHATASLILQIQMNNTKYNPRKQTWSLKMMVCKRNFLSNSGIILISTISSTNDRSYFHSQQGTKAFSKASPSISAIATSAREGSANSASNRGPAGGVENMFKGLDVKT